MKKRYVVVDYDPAVIETLEHLHINHIYGDATDLELLDEIGVHKSELIISTLADFETNQLLLRHIRKNNKKASYICHAASYEDAEALYEDGAAFVILPHLLGSEQINAFIRHNGSDNEAFEKFRQRQADTISKAMLRS